MLLGTIVNTIAVIIGCCIGLFIKGGIKERFKVIIMQALGLAVLFVGASSAIGGLMDENAHPILFIVSLVVGGFIGEALGIEDKLDHLGLFLQNKIGGEGNNIAQGFVTASLTFCVGSMAILGSFESGIQGVHTTLITKSVLDGVAAMIFASTLGVGVIFSAVPVFLYQGTLTLFASVLQPYLTADMIREISIVGGIMITGLGINILQIKQLKTGNLLPALAVPVIFYLPIVQMLLHSV